MLTALKFIPLIINTLNVGTNCVFLWFVNFLVSGKYYGFNLTAPKFMFVQPPSYLGITSSLSFPQHGCRRVCYRLLD